MPIKHFIGMFIGFHRLSNPPPTPTSRNPEKKGNIAAKKMFPFQIHVKEIQGPLSGHTVSTRLLRFARCCFEARTRSLGKGRKAKEMKRQRDKTN